METSQENVTLNEATEATQENAEKTKEPSKATGIIKAVVTTLLAVIAFTLIVVFIALIITRPSNIGNAIENLDVSSTIDYIYDNGLIENFVSFANNTLELDAELNVSDVRTILDNDIVIDEVNDILNNYLAAAAEGDFAYYMTSEDIADTIKSIASNIDKDFDFTDEMHTAIATSFYINNTLRENSFGNIMEKAGIDVAMSWVFFSFYPTILICIITLLLIFNIFLINNKKPEAAVLVTGIIIALAGILYTVAALLANTILGFLSGIVHNVVSGIVSSFITPGIICLIIGIVIIGVSFVLRFLLKKRDTKTDNNKSSKLWLYTGIGGNAGALVVSAVLVFMCINAMPTVRADWREYRDSDEYTLAAIPPTPTPTPTPTPIPTLKDDILPKAQVGDVISIGEYDWLILDIQDDMALVISDTVIELSKYHDIHFSKTWEGADIRFYLNNEFLLNFNDSELDAITETILPNNNNPWYATRGGNDTNDKVFLLSLDEVMLYFGDSGQYDNRPGYDITLIDDEYNNARIAKTADGSPVTWWLRTPGRVYSGGNNAIVIDENGVINISGAELDDTYGIRPAMWLSMS